MKKRRIRIHQKTLKLMNDPEYIYIWINPENREIAICSADKSSKDVLKINKARECEIYSKFLFDRLKTTTPNLEKDRTYRFEGTLSQNRRIARFKITDTNVFHGQGKSYE